MGLTPSLPLLLLFTCPTFCFYPTLFLASLYPFSLKYSQRDLMENLLFGSQMSQKSLKTCGLFLNHLCTTRKPHSMVTDTHYNPR